MDTKDFLGSQSKVFLYQGSTQAAMSCSYECNQPAIHVGGCSAIITWQTLASVAVSMQNHRAVAKIVCEIINLNYYLNATMQYTVRLDPKGDTSAANVCCLLPTRIIVIMN